MDLSSETTRLREGEVLQRLEISQKRLRALRRDVLSENGHYGRDAAGIWYTEEAVVLMGDRLAQGVPLPLDDRADDAGIPLEHGAQPPPVAVLQPGQRIEDDRLVEDLRITRVWAQRDKMVLCQRPNGLEVVVRVQSSANLRPGQVLQGCYRGEYQIWYYNGPLPRGKRGGRCLGFFPPR